MQCVCILSQKTSGEGAIMGGHITINFNPKYLPGENWGQSSCFGFSLGILKKTVKKSLKNMCILLSYK